MAVKGVITERVPLSFDLAEQMLDVRGGYVHTFAQAGPALLGADWEVDMVHKAIKEHGVELAGEVATAMNYGLVINRPKSGPLFLATKEGCSGADQI